jgi:hypothetical protein
MSEYQFYEFRTIDKPLSQKEKIEISEWSSRTTPSNTGAIFEYHYSDFPKNEIKIIEKYFDAMFYFANWGEIRLIFRFPKDSLDKKGIEPYLCDGIKLTEKPTCSILQIDISPEDSCHHVFEGNGILASLLSLRNDILAGDYRCLYLIWLQLRSSPELGHFLNNSLEIEPEVPKHLDSISAALAEFIEVFGIDHNIL